MNSKKDFIVVVVMLSVIGMDDLSRRRMEQFGMSSYFCISAFFARCLKV